MERRQFKRFAADPKYRAKLILADEVLLKDISLGGLSLRTSQRLSPNSTYRVELVSSDNERITPTVTVVRSFFKGTIDREGETLPLYEVGLKFVELNEREREFLERFINDSSLRGGTVERD
jgi:c-di-GMP-binding flagellar brake protein YcgR